MITQRLGRRRRLRAAQAAAADVALGVAAAWRAPLAVRGPRFQALLAGSAVEDGSGVRWPGLAIRTANAVLRVLSRLPAAGRFWKNTCLFRSVATCIVLRRRGISARLRLGIRTGDYSSQRIQAHAWVELEAHNRAHARTRSEYVPLSPAR